MAVKIPIEEFVLRPYAQGLAILFLSFGALLITRPKSKDSVYTISGIFYAGFILANCVLSFFATKVWPYFFQSMLASLLYVVLAGLLIELYCKLFSPRGSGESGTVFLVVIYHPLISLFSILTKWGYTSFFST